MASVTLVPLSEYLRSSYEPDAEFVDGRIEERCVGERDHSDLQGRVFLLLSDPSFRTWFTAHPELRVQTLATHFRVPDICLLRAGSPREKIVRTPPLLCVEVLSPEDTLARTMVKVREYVVMGVAAAWVVDPARRTVRVVTVAGEVESGDGVVRVPETPVELAVREIFAILDDC